MSYPKFDQDRPFGESSPIENGCCFWQNGHHYDADFNCIDITGKMLQRHVTEEPVSLRQPAPPAPDDTPIDLVAWAKGEQKVQWFAVKKELETQGYEPLPTTAEEARSAILAKAA